MPFNKDQFRVSAHGRQAFDDLLDIPSFISAWTNYRDGRTNSSLGKAQWTGNNPVCKTHPAKPRYVCKVPICEWSQDGYSLRKQNMRALLHHFKIRQVQ